LDCLKEGAATWAGTIWRLATSPLTVTAWLRWDVVERLLPTAATRVLDIGMGAGAMGSFLAERYDYVGVEPDSTSYATAKSHIGDRGVLHNDAIEALDLGHDFDLVCAFEVLEHIENDTAALSLWVRHLRPGGWLLVSVPQGRERFATGDARVGHLRRYDPTDLIQKLAAAGLENIMTVVYGSPWGNLQETIRGALFHFRPSARPIAERTAASGRFLQPPTWGAFGTRAISLPLRYAQRPFSSRGVGTGLVALGQLPTIQPTLNDDSAAQEVHDLGRRCSRAEDLGHPEALKLVGVVLRDRSADYDQHVVGAVRAQPLDDPWHQRHVRAGQDRHAHSVGVLLDGSLDDLLRRLVKTRVDDLHPGITQGSSDDLRAAIVAVQTGLCDHYSNRPRHMGRIPRCA